MGWGVVWVRARCGSACFPSAAQPPSKKLLSIPFFYSKIKLPRKHSYALEDEGGGEAVGVGLRSKNRKDAPGRQEHS